MALKAGIIGLGRMGSELSSRLDGMVPHGWIPVSHAEAIMTTENVDLVAVCDVNEEALKKCMSNYPVKKAYTNYGKMLNENNLDIVCVATRTDARGEIIHTALQSGVKGFYAEKPLSRSLGETKNLLREVETADAKIVYGATRRAMDVYKKAKEICYSEELGGLKQIVIEFGRAALLWTHPHSSDLISFFASSTDLKSVQGVCYLDDTSRCSCNFIDSDPIVENAFATFGNGISAVITQVEGLNIRLACTEGTVTVHKNGYCIEINKSRNFPTYIHAAEKIFTESSKSGTQYLMEDLRDAIIYNRMPKNISPKEILCGQQLLFGLVQSTLQKTSVNPSDIDDDLIVTGRTGHHYA